MIKKLSLTKETVRLLASSDPFDAIANEQTPQINGGHRGGVPKPGRSGWRGCTQHPKPGPSGMMGCSVALACPDGVKGLI